MSLAEYPEIKTAGTEKRDVGEVLTKERAALSPRAGSGICPFGWSGVFRLHFRAQFDGEHFCYHNKQLCFQHCL